MSSLAAQAAKRYRRMMRSGQSQENAFDRALGYDLDCCYLGYARCDRKTAVILAPNCSTESSVRVLFPDDSVLIFDNSEALVARLMNSVEDGSVYSYSSDLAPVSPIGRYGRRFSMVRYPFTEPEIKLMDGALQLVDSVLLDKYGLGLPIYMQWFWKHRLLVRNLVSAGGDEVALCSLLLGMIGNKQLPINLDQVSRDEVNGTTIIVRHQQIP